MVKKNILSKFLKPGEEGTVVIKVIFGVILRVKKWLDLRDTNLCLGWVNWFCRIKTGKPLIKFRTVGFGYVTQIKPAKKLLDEQMEQIILKREKKLKEN